MPHFTKPSGDYAPFGKNEYRRSTKGLLYESYTFSAASMPTVTIDGTVQKVLQSGVVLAKITSGAESGKVGVFQADATDGRQTAANIVGVNDTFLPWQLLKRDADVSACYHGTLDQAKCIEYNTAGAPIALTNTTADAMRGTKGLDLMFHAS
ncbi:scaffolding protein [Rhodococcus phage Mbo2]|uniref:Scaffolding protein n=1 Tax=Rhodococcus phage Mbo2 TaxID=2936911 RepID=A0A9E7LBL3_9CAUD|nr:scaffolding protein [Rhodococcus phage Mbo2]